MNSREIKILTPIPNSSASKNDLGDVLAPNKFGNGVGDTVTL